MSRTDCIEWDEPFDSRCATNVTLRMTVVDAIKAQREIVLYRQDGTQYIYESDDDALADFMVVRWARFVPNYPKYIEDLKHQLASFGRIV